MRNLYAIMRTDDVKFLQSDNSWGAGKTCRVFTTKSAATQAKNHRKKYETAIVPLKAMMCNEMQQEFSLVETRADAKEDILGIIEDAPDDAVFFLALDKHNEIKLLETTYGTPLPEYVRGVVEQIKENF